MGGSGWNFPIEAEVKNLECMVKINDHFCTDIFKFCTDTVPLHSSLL